MFYIYILDENDICVQIAQYYDGETYANLTKDKKFVKLDEYRNVLEYKYINGDFKQVPKKQTLNRKKTQYELLEEVLVKLKAIEDKLGVDVNGE